MSESDSSRASKKERTPEEKEAQRKRRADRKARAEKEGGSTSESKTGGGKKRKSKKERPSETDEEKEARRAARRAAKAELKRKSTEASEGAVSESRGSQPSASETDQSLSEAPETVSREDKVKRRARQASEHAAGLRKEEEEMKARREGTTVTGGVTNSASPTTTEPSKTEASETATPITSETALKTVALSDEGTGPDKSAAQTDEKTKETQKKLEEKFRKKRSPSEKSGETSIADGKDVTEDEIRAKRRAKRAEKAARGEKAKEREEKAKADSVPSEATAKQERVEDSGYHSDSASETDIKPGIGAAAVSNASAPDTRTQDSQLIATSPPDPKLKAETQVTSIADDNTTRKLIRDEQKAADKKERRRAERKMFDPQTADSIRHGRAASGSGYAPRPACGQPTIPEVTATIDRPRADTPASTAPPATSVPIVTEPTAGLPATSMTSPTIISPDSPAKVGGNISDLEMMSGALPATQAAPATQKKRKGSRSKSRSARSQSALPDTQVTDPLVTSIPDTQFNVTDMLFRWAGAADMTVTSLKSDIFQVDATGADRTVIESAAITDFSNMKLNNGTTLGNWLMTDTGRNESIAQTVSRINDKNAFSALGTAWPATMILGGHPFIDASKAQSTMGALRPYWDIKAPITEAAAVSAAPQRPARQKTAKKEDPAKSDNMTWTDGTEQPSKINIAPVPPPSVLENVNTAVTDPLPVTSVVLPPTIEMVDVPDVNNAANTAPASLRTEGIVETAITAPLPPITTDPAPTMIASPTATVDFDVNARIKEVMLTYFEDFGKRAKEMTEASQTALTVPPNTTTKRTEATQRDGRGRSGSRTKGDSSKGRSKSRSRGSKPEGSRSDSRGRKSSRKSRSGTTENALATTAG